MIATIFLLSDDVDLLKFVEILLILFGFAEVRWLQRTYLEFVVELGKELLVFLWTLNYLW